MRLEKGKRYTIDMVADLPLDSYLILEDSGKKRLIEDDDGGGFPNVRIVYSISETGLYRVIATSFGNLQTGPFTLTIREQ